MVFSIYRGRGIGKIHTFSDFFVDWYEIAEIRADPPKLAPPPCRIETAFPCFYPIGSTRTPAPAHIRRVTLRKHDLEAVLSSGPKALQLNFSVSDFFEDLPFLFFFASKRL